MFFLVLYFFLFLCDNELIEPLSTTGIVLNRFSLHSYWEYNVCLKGLDQAKIIKKSVILFWLLNMTI